MSKYHDHQTAGHPGELETLNQIKEYYWWPGMRVFIKNYCKGCAICQQYKINRNPSKPTLNPIKAATSQRPFANCSWDLITDLPESNGYNAILSVVDHGLTKGVIIIPTRKTTNEKDIAQLLIENVYRRFGLPDSIISDRDPRFASRVFQEFLRLLGVKSKMTTAFHPQADGSTERYNQEIEAYISIYCANNPRTWSMKTAIMEFTHNDRRHADRKKTPFELIMGLSPIAIPMTFFHSKYPEAEERIRNLQKDREEAIAAHELARQRMITRTRNGFKPFKKGQMVWLDSRNLKTGYTSKKIAPKREGPFQIKEVLGPLTYRLELPMRWKIHNVFHATLLMPYTENEEHGPNFNRPPPDLIDGEEEYEVETIINHKRHGRGYLYLTKWAGYPDSENSWQTATSLTNAQEILDNYRRLHSL